MATRGRKPKPKTLKILDGTRPDRINAKAPEAIRELPECPVHMVDDPDACEEWGRMVALLDRMGVLSQTDGAALSLYCTIHSRWRKAKSEVMTVGFTISTEQSGEKTNPTVGVMERCEVQLRALLAEFGCTPSSRGRLDRLKADVPPDEFEELLSSKPKRKA